MGFLHGVDGIAEVLEGVVGSEDANLAVAEWPAMVEVSCDVGTVEVDGFVAGAGLRPPQRSIFLRQFRSHQRSTRGKCTGRGCSASRSEMNAFWSPSAGIG